ncbi:hypothetical protein BDP55DRAFT_396815 [Colletotrichum godetiae]|uniref:Uncharacterized protein n=1 Tax=Colletotrichum godetiae TaxID=1209918 RepID=A0AAJ0A8N6_9PEZI|nr:uncharacterized protein BDP55DRAFT_396815 [Colletotrichum godetiae]KAK1658566.1 hypothetical protein BDP55DRAFT_396815 [Colletotrichum godetiae]
MMLSVAQTISPAEPRFLRPYSTAKFRDILGRTTYSCVQGPCSILLRWWFSVPYFASNMAVEYLYEHPRYVGKDKLPENRYNPLDLAEWKTSARRLRSTSPPFRSGDRVDRETSRLGARPKHHPDHLRHGQQFSISTDCDDRRPTANAKKSNPAVWSPDFRQRQTWDGRVQVGCASITKRPLRPTSSTITSFLTTFPHSSPPPSRVLLPLQLSASDEHVPTTAPAIAQAGESLVTCRNPYLSTTRCHRLLEVS